MKISYISEKINISDRIIENISIQYINRTISRLESRLCQNFTSVSLILFEITIVKKSYGPAETTLEIDPGHKNKKIGLYPKSLGLF